MSGHATNGATPYAPDRPARPFLKWAGGKTQLLDELVARAPHRIETYYEPFVGGGALFFRLAARVDGQPQHAVLNDLNVELIATFRAVRDDVDLLIRRLRRLERDYLGCEGAARADYYYALRNEYCSLVARSKASDLDIATRFIFLNKTCFNGLYRVNRSGEFNVPHGRYRKPRILDREGLKAAARTLNGVELTSVDFEEACRNATAADFVYFDPPFHPLSDTSSFTAYTEGSFGRADQLRLRWWVDELSRRGAPTLVSNSAHPWVLGVYQGGGYAVEEVGAMKPHWPDRGRTEQVAANRLINSRADRRQGASELVISNQSVLSASAKKS